LGNLGLVYRMNNNLYLALDTLKTAIIINPKLAHLYYTLAIIYRDLGKIYESAEQLNIALELDPSLKEEIAHLRVPKTNKNQLKN